MSARIRDQGLRVAEIEGTPGWLSGRACDDARVLGLEESLDLAAAMGASSVVAYHDGRATPEAALVEDFAAACDRAAGHNLTLALEFLPFSPLATLRHALAIAGEAGRPNGRVVLDSWHHAHSGQGALSLRTDQAGLISCLQLVDARPAQTDDVVAETMQGRRVPGTGTIDLTGLIADLQTAGVACPVAVEVYDETLVDLDARAYASALADGARRTLRGAG